MPVVVMSEVDTLDACESHSIARFGDGELRLAVGGGCSSQAADPKLRSELVRILSKQRGMLVGIPNFERTPRQDVWDKYKRAPFAGLYRLPAYGSSFITRPDNAPWIDTPDYWAKVRALWFGQDVTLVVGDEKSITKEMLSTARSVRMVWGPRQHAYAEIDRIEQEIIGARPGLVLLCLGATATVLASRLDERGIHALDLGHMGMFMKHAGLYGLRREDLLSGDYQQQIQQKHASMRWGADGHSHAPAVRLFAEELGAKSILDYGCGRGTLAQAISDRRVMEYDPGVTGKEKLPKPADLVVCTDVLEHIEPERVDAVLQHLFLLAGKGAYLVISLRPARESLPDGRNAHLTVQPKEWWLERIRDAGWNHVVAKMEKGLCVWLKKSA